MNLNLQIDRLILEDIDLSLRQRRQLQAAIETELSRLLSENGIPPHLQNGGTIPKLPINLSPSPAAQPTQMGQQIAQTIYGGLTS